MCKVEMIRALLHARLSAAVEEICVLLRTTIAQYEEELCRAKEENDRQRRQLDAVCGVRDRPRTADVSEEDLRHEHQELESPHVEEEKEDIATFPLTVIVKSEEGDGDHCRGSQAHGRSAPLLDGDDITSLLS
ncbi:uncharacterized protein LOC133468934 isoform X2 [Phyllopteryx taeniolatus]|uniref:uncharacterized protein LOC133468934 isoform X2 n=1 Tax=Phyllopteryx taeniolatus TaxID=161469 RepID=UPI002AD56059|nr:uncharacterized protein LOC133468934 isoform X2 [Phyllopteryx taeniolatus]